MASGPSHHPSIATAVASAVASAVAATALMLSATKLSLGDDAGRRGERLDIRDRALQSGQVLRRAGQEQIRLVLLRAPGVTQPGIQSSVAKMAVPDHTYPGAEFSRREFFGHGPLDGSRV